MKTHQLLAACIAGVLSLSSAATFAPAAPRKPDYRQVEAVNRADSLCKDVAKALIEIQKAQEAIEKPAEGAAVPERAIPELNDQIKFANNKLDNAERAIKNLPANDPDVKAQSEKIASQRAALAKASEASAGLAKKLGAVEEIGRAPDFKKDVEQLKAMTKAYAPFQLSTDPKRTVELAGRVAEDVKTLAALQQTYKPIVQQKTAEGKQFSYNFETATNNVNQFRLKCQAYHEKGEEAIGQTLTKALKMAEQAAAEKKPAFFTGGVQQQLDIAKKNLEVYVALVGEKDEKTVRVQANFDENIKKIDTLRDSLKAEILASTKTPPDLYKGADKAKLKGLVEQEWKTLYAKDELLGVKFVTPEWKRKSGANWNAGNKAFEDFDYSELVVRVVVKSDDKLSKLYWVYLTKDHMSNDLISINAKTKGGIYVVEEMLTSNFEP